MNALQQKFDNLVVLGFPCNQFGLQEPGANGTEILNGIRYVRPGNNFLPNFQLFAKIDVNGEKEHPLYTYLKSQCPETTDTFREPTKLHYRPLKNSDVRWNWEKFLVNGMGKPVKRYDPSVTPSEIELDIQEEIDALAPDNRNRYSRFKG